MKTISYLVLAGALLLTGSIRAEEMESTGKKKRVDIHSVVNGNTDFAFDLYGHLKGEDGNLFFSPYSISTALAMTYAGARGETAEQMSYVLNFSHPQELNPKFGNLIEDLNKQGQQGDYQLSVANALWGQKDYPFLDSFIVLNKQHYKAGLETVDFVDSAEREKTRKMINQWVEDNTNQKIKNLIPEGVLNELTRLVLTNAIYFKGDWTSQFDAKATRDQDFYLSPEKTVKAPLMYQKAKFKYGQTDSLQLLELPYEGDDLSMLVLLPNAKDGLGDLEKELNADNLAQWQQQMRDREIQVYLPKFKMASQFSLSDTLAKMGMPDAFNDKADFSGMDGSKMLYISAVLHKAFVEVNEEGTEAAAATGVVMTLKSAPRPSPVFRADHPFVFIIKDNTTNSILFIGRVVDPTKAGE